jgi:hypothetical protein
VPDVEFPGGRGNEAGLAAVAAKYGPDVAQRFRNWPKLAEVYTRAQYGDDAMVQREVEQAEVNLGRAKRDRDYALAQAEVIVRRLPSDSIAVVPSVAQLRRGWGL